MSSDNEIQIVEAATVKEHEPNVSLRGGTVNRLATDERSERGGA